MALNLVSSNDTVARTRFAVKVDDANTDRVIGVIPIPPGSTVRQIDINCTTISEQGIDMHFALEHGVHGYFLGFSKPDHGYSKDFNGYNAMWDDLVPKDHDVDLSLVEYGSDSAIGGDSEVSGPVEGGAFDNSDSGTSINVGTMVNAWQGPKCFFTRVKRLDVSNGIVSKENQYRAFDSIKTSIKRNYFMSKDRYWFLVMAGGNSSFEAISEMGHIPDTDVEWNSLTFPELIAFGGLVLNDATHEYQATIFENHLESAYIQANTYKDLSDTQAVGEDDDESEKLVYFNNLTVRYTRPTVPIINANSRDGLG